MGCKFFFLPRHHVGDGSRALFCFHGQPPSQAVTPSPKSGKGRLARLTSQSLWRLKNDGEPVERSSVGCSVSCKLGGTRGCAVGWAAGSDHRGFSGSILPIYLQEEKCRAYLFYASEVHAIFFPGPFRGSLYFWSNTLTKAYPVVGGCFPFFLFSLFFFFSFFSFLFSFSFFQSKSSNSR